MASFIDAQGQVQQLNLDVTMYKVAADNGMSFQQYINTQYPTNAEKYGSTFSQLMASEGIFVKADRELGIRPSTMADIMDGRPRVEAGINVKDAVPASRILFPAVFMQAIEDKLVANLSMACMKTAGKRIRLAGTASLTLMPASTRGRPSMMSAIVEGRMPSSRSALTKMPSEAIN